MTVCPTYDQNKQRLHRQTARRWAILWFVCVLLLAALSPKKSKLVCVIVWISQCVVTKVQETNTR
jgi:hypothetical protein